jgi:signal transduction histidine kinase
MSLTTRLSAVFLTSLAVVLVGFSLVLYLLARHHLAEQLDARLEASAQTLVASFEVHDENVEWEPGVRRVPFGENRGPDQVWWLIVTPAGELVDCARNLETQPDVGGPDWRVLVRRVRAGSLTPETVDHEDFRRGQLLTGIDENQLPGHKSLSRDRSILGPAMDVRVGLSWTPVAVALRQLAWTLAGVSCGLWLMAALLSRMVCRRALRPVIQMAASARSLKIEADRDLAVPSSGDELEELGKAFNGLLGRLHDALQRQQRFSGDASHQLRTPLTALLGQVEVALRQERSPAEYQRVLGVVQRRAEQMRRMVELLLILARQPAQTDLPEMQVIDLGEWLNAQLKNWADHPRAADLRREAIGASGARVRTQPALLGQLLDNLLDNACKYSEPGSIITVRIELIDSTVELNVVDHGCGMGAEELAHICEPFYRSSEARRLGRPGFGLGLTVVQHLVNVLGGRLAVDSQLNKGSRFRIFLPAVAAVPAREEAAAEEVGANGTDEQMEEKGRNSAGGELLNCRKN